MYPSCFEALRFEFLEYKKTFPLSDIKIPTQITHGDCDGTVPFSNAQRLADEIQGAELITIEGGWHFLVFDKSYEKIFADQIAFINKHN